MLALRFATFQNAMRLKIGLSRLLKNCKIVMPKSKFSNAVWCLFGISFLEMRKSRCTLQKFEIRLRQIKHGNPRLDVSNTFLRSKNY